MSVEKYVGPPPVFSMDIEGLPSKLCGCGFTENALNERGGCSRPSFTDMAAGFARK